MLKFLISFICFIVTFLNANSQVNGIEKKRDQKIDSKSLIGPWRNLDVSGSDIVFIDSTYQVILETNQEQIYYFEKDSSGNVSPNGWFPQWPPPSCELVFISRDTLKVFYTQISDTLGTFYFIRK